MDILIRNAEGNLSATNKEYAAKKLGNLDRFFNQANKVEIVHKELKMGVHHVVVTVFADGYTIRGEADNKDVHTAIDKVSEKLDLKLRKLHRKLHDSYRKRGHTVPIGLLSLQDKSEPEEEPQLRLKERKQFLVKPMSLEEAALQLELVGHAFFLFRNEVNNNMEVLYRRNDGHYGLLQPEG
jgi:putative sigma-54 modulation protein